MEEKNKINAVIETVMKNLNNLIDVNTVIGKPMKTDDGKTVIPVSKVTMGFMTGGGEYGEIKLFKKNDNMPFAGGSGAIVSIKPVCFLINDDKSYKILNVSNDNIDKIVDSTTNFLHKLQGDNL